MDFLKDLLHTFIPHEGNGYKPHFFRVRAVLTTAAVILVLTGAAFSAQKLILSQYDYLAAVISSVLVDLTNGDRGANGLAHLSMNPVLQRAAELKAADMAAKGYFAHVSPDGATPWQWFDEAGYEFVYAGENLATFFSDSADVERAWMNSPGHRANILNSNFTEIGIATAEGVYQGQSTVFVVQMFGSPAVPTSKSVLVTEPESEINETEEVATTPLESTASNGAGDTPAVTVVATTEPATTSPTEILGTTVTEVPLKALALAPEVIVEDETFIAVRREAATNSPLALAATAENDTSLIQRIVTSPQTSVNMILVIIAAVIALALALMVGIELKRQHPVNILYGIALLALIGGIIYLTQAVAPVVAVL